MKLIKAVSTECGGFYKEDSLSLLYGAAGSCLTRCWMTSYFFKGEIKMTKLGPVFALLWRDQVICEQFYNLKANVCLYPLKLFTFRWNQRGKLAFICSFPLIWAFRPLLLYQPSSEACSFHRQIRGSELWFVQKRAPIKGGGGMGRILLCCLFFTHLCNYPFLYVIGHAAFIMSALWMLQRKGTFTVRCNALLVSRCHFRPGLGCIIRPELPHYPGLSGAYQCTSAPVAH